MKSPSRWVWYLSGRLLAAPHTPATFQPDPLWMDGKPVPVLPVSLAGAGSHPRARVPVGRMSGAGSGGGGGVTKFGCGWRCSECPAGCAVGGRRAP